jgi:regulatory protein
VPRGPAGGEGQEPRRRKRVRAPRPSPSELAPAERREQAHAAALRLLSHRERSRAELRLRLRGKGYDVDTIESALDRIAAAGLQSDDRFSEMFTLESQRGRGLSATAIQGELRRRGIDRELAAQAAAEPPEAEEARARALARKRAGQLSRLAPEVRRRRLEGFLARRGYRSELCRRLAVEESGSAGDAG